jgi:hypothetical protein
VEAALLRQAPQKEGSLGFVEVSFYLLKGSVSRLKSDFLSLRCDSAFAGSFS